MIPVVHFEENTEYTVTINSGVVRGVFTGSSSGKLTFANATVYTIALNGKDEVKSIVLDFSDIISVGQCSERRYAARNDLCWKLNDAAINK